MELGLSGNSDQRGLGWRDLRWGVRIGDFRVGGFRSERLESKGLESGKLCSVIEKINRLL